MRADESCLFGGAEEGIGGGYANTAQGKVIVAAFMDSCNGNVKAVQIYKAQEKLNALGFPVGTPDGIMGPRTRAELKRFQQSRGVPASGVLDPATIAAFNQ